MGNQTGAAYMKRDGIRGMQVISMVSFSLPKLLPAKASRMLTRGEARVNIDSTWQLNSK